MAASLAAHFALLAAFALAPAKEPGAEALYVEVLMDFAEEESAAPAAPVRRAPPKAAVASPAESAAASAPVEASDEVVERSSAPAPAAAAAESGGSPSARELDASQRYALELRQLLERRKTYPAPARRLGKQGKVLVRFTLGRDGAVMKAEILESSSHEILNEAARELVKAVNGFRPFPEEITKATWDFLVPIEYRL